MKRALIIAMLFLVGCLTTACNFGLDSEGNPTVKKAVSGQTMQQYGLDKLPIQQDSVTMGTTLTQDGTSLTPDIGFKLQNCTAQFQLSRQAGGTYNLTADGQPAGITLPDPTDPMTYYSAMVKLLVDKGVQKDNKYGCDPAKLKDAAAAKGIKA